MATVRCRRCGGEVVHKPRARPAPGGTLMIAAVGMGTIRSPLWAPALVLGLAGVYLLTWASLGRGRRCRGCKRFDGVQAAEARHASASSLHRPLGVAGVPDRRDGRHQQ